ncbi:MAG: cysteine--tRNA ligase [bacterium]
MKLYNTFSNTKEDFVPTEEGKVKIYTCGPTVYDYIHLGNARAFIVSDVIRRFFKYLKYDVTFVMNLTDIDDKIIERAQKDNSDTKFISEKYAQAFFEDLDALGVEPADVFPKATEHVPEMIELIRELIKKDKAYVSGGDVYYDVAKFERYGNLSGKKIDELISGTRVAIDKKKRNPLDFVLWKAQKPREPAWESPWGLGRPGWHLECSAMSMKYLGASFDIHVGGVDLVFPHHENEIAQSEGATEQPFVKYWLHNGFLQIEGHKMSKSLGNFSTVREALQTIPSEALRLFFLQKHYRSPIDLTDQGFETAKRAHSRLSIFYEKLKAATPDFDSERTQLPVVEPELAQPFEKFKNEFVASMKDDFNTPGALSQLFDFVREANKLFSKEELTVAEGKLLKRIRGDVEDFRAIFGILQTQDSGIDSNLVSSLTGLLIEVRNDLRSKKLWDLADKIRNELGKQGIVLEDAGNETTWRFN